MAENDIEECRRCACEECRRCRCDQCHAWDRQVSHMRLHVGTLAMRFDAVARLVSFVAEKTLGECPSVSLEIKDGLSVKLPSYGVALKGDPKGPQPWGNLGGAQDIPKSKEEKDMDAGQNTQLEHDECVRCDCKQCLAQQRQVSDLVFQVANLWMRLDAVSSLASFVAERTLGERPSVLLVGKDGMSAWTKFSSKGVTLMGDYEASQPSHPRLDVPELDSLLQGPPDSGG